MKKIMISNFAAVLIASSAALAHGAPPAKVTEATPNKTITKMAGLNLVEGTDKKLHLILDGQRIGSVLLDPEWADSKSAPRLKPSPYWEPKPRKKPKPPDQCIYAICLPDNVRDSQIIKLPQDVREIGVVTIKKAQ